MLENSRFNVTLDTEKCCGDGVCEQVCPRNCFDIDTARRIAIMAQTDQCIRCGACIVQCPCDALYFKNSNGESILPETIRKFKLNLLGKRQTNRRRE
jgi:NAD-dependent dihydropyrimidine dehydrogenase PreA subunit